MSVGDCICVLFVTSAGWWFLTAHTALSCLVILIAGLLCLVWLLAHNPHAKRVARAGLLALAAAALVACTLWALIELAQHL